MDETTQDAINEKTDIIVDYAVQQITGMPVGNADMVLINTAEDMLCMAMSRLNAYGIDKMLDLLNKNIRWRLDEIHKEK